MRRHLLALLLALSLAPSFSAAQTPVPALPDTERRTEYVLSASTCACAVNFSLFGDGTDFGNWIEVWLRTGSGTSQVWTKLTAVTDYTVTSPSGALSGLARPITNAIVTLVTARTGTLEIVGSRRPRRTSQFTENQGVTARALNQVLTDIISSNRETWDRTNDTTGRAMLIPPGDTIGQLPATAIRAGGILGFDGSGNPFITSALTGLGNVVGPNVSVIGHIPVFANTSGTLLADGGLIGTGDVVGPASSTANHAVTFADTTGKLVKDSGLTLTASTGTFTLTNAKTLAVTNTLTLGGTDGSTVAFGTGGTVTYTANNLSVFAATTSAQLRGVLSDETGTGVAVFNDTPTLSTPVLGIATATSINKVAFTAPATGSTLTIADGKTLTASNSITISGTDAKALVLTTGLTVTTNDGTLAFGAASKTLTVNNSIGLSGTDGKTLTVSNSGTLGGADGWTLAIAASKTLTVSNTLTFTGTDSTSFAFPSTSDTVTGNAATQTLTNKTLTSPTINGGTATALTSLGIRSSGGGAFDLTLANSETLSAARTLTLTVNNAARTIDLSGNLTLAAAFTTAGGNAITLTGTGTTNLTLPTSGTLATIDVGQTFSAANIFSALTTVTDLKFTSGKLYPSGDSTTALQLCKADGTTCIVRVDTTNSRVGVNKTPGAYDLDVNGAVNVGTTLTFTTLSATSLGASTSTITGLTINNTPNASNDYLLYYSAADAAIRRCTVGSCAAAATAGVSSLNGLTGALSITAGSGANVAASGTTVTLTGSQTVNAQTGTTYTVLDGDRAKLVTYSNAAAIAVTLPQAGAASSFLTGWFADFRNISTGAAGIVTITPTTSTIGGAATYVLRPGRAVRVVSDGTNYLIATTGGLPTQPTTQKFLSGSGTYTTPANVNWLEIRAIGGGAGGRGAGTSAGAGASGGNTCWNTTGAACTTPVYQGTGGVAGGTGSGGTGGGVTGSGTCLMAIPGGSGTGIYTNAGTAQGGSPGGSGALGGGGGGSDQGVAGLAGTTNSGGGGGGGGANGTALSGTGGGAGGFCYVILNSPAGTYTYAVGAAGTGGTAGTSGAAGGDGAAGGIWVIEHYNP